MITTLPKPKTDQIPMPAGVSDLYSLLAFLQDPKKVEAHLKRIEQATSNANTAIQAVGDAQKITQLLAEAENKNAKADQLLEEAATKASELVSNATAEARRTTDSLEKQAQALREEQARIKADNAANIKLLDEREKACKAQETELLKTRRELDALKASLDRQSADIERKKQVLSQL